MQRVLNSYEELREILNDTGRILFVHGKSAEKFSALCECLSSLSAEVFNFTDFTPNPKLEEAKAACEVFERQNCVFLLTGGGAQRLT